MSKVDPMVKKALEAAPAAAHSLTELKCQPSPGSYYWSTNTDTMGVYGNDYLKRAIIAQLGLGAPTGRSIYPLNLADETGNPLDGASKYTIHFEKGATPPVNAFWSLTLYTVTAFRWQTV